MREAMRVRGAEGRREERVSMRWLKDSAGVRPLASKVRPNHISGVE